MNIPANLKYAKTHEWVRQDVDGLIVVGITDHAQEALGDIVFIELPEVGRELAAGKECAVVESVKAASDIYAPVSGTVVEVNATVVDTPEHVNQDAYNAWLFKIKPGDTAELDGLLDDAGYAKALASE